MIDDYRHSIGRTVVYRHPGTEKPELDHSQHTAGRTVGVVCAVKLGNAPEHEWIYTIENSRTGEIVHVPERCIYYGTLGRHERRAGTGKVDINHLAETIARTLNESSFTNLLKTTVRDLINREEAEEKARRLGRDLPLNTGDYIRVRGDLRAELSYAHNHYAKIVGVMEPDIAAIESSHGVHAVKKAYRTLLDDGSEAIIYDPEVKLYYTADGRATILNWRAAIFLAEAFQDDPPYSVEYSYLEDHVFTRDELEPLSSEELSELFSALLYVKGRMGLRDFEKVGSQLSGIPKEYLIDNILAISRFDMRHNRTLTKVEIENKRKELMRLRRFLRGR